MAPEKGGVAGGVQPGQVEGMGVDHADGGGNQPKSGRLGFRGQWSAM